MECVKVTGNPAFDRLGSTAVRAEADAFLKTREWQGLSPTDRQALDDRVREQFIGGIVPSSDTLYRQELDQENQRAARLRRTRRSMAVLAAVLIATIGAAAWIYTLKTKANIAQQTAEQATRIAAMVRIRAALTSLIRHSGIESPAST